MNSTSIRDLRESLHLKPCLSIKEKLLTFKGNKNYDYYMNGMEMTVIHR